MKNNNMFCNKLHYSAKVSCESAIGVRDLVIIWKERAKSKFYFNKIFRINDFCNLLEICPGGLNTNVLEMFFLSELCPRGQVCPKYAWVSQVWLIYSPAPGLHWQITIPPKMTKNKVLLLGWRWKYSKITNESTSKRAKGYLVLCGCAKVNLRFSSVLYLLYKSSSWKRLLRTENALPSKSVIRSIRVLNSASIDSLSSSPVYFPTYEYFPLPSTSNPLVFNISSLQKWSQVITCIIK